MDNVMRLVFGLAIMIWASEISGPVRKSYDFKKARVAFTAVD